MEGFDYEEGQPIMEAFDDLYPREFKENQLFLPESISFRHPPMMSYIGSNVVPTFAQYSASLNAKDLGDLKNHVSGSFSLTDKRFLFASLISFPREFPPATVHLPRFHEQLRWAESSFSRSYWSSRNACGFSDDFYRQEISAPFS